MSTHFTTTDDLSVADGLEPVTLLRRELLAGPGEPVPYALRRSIDVAEVIDENRKTIESDGRYTAGDASWSLPAAELSAPPRLGDVILDAAGRRWTILQTRLVAIRGRWRCRTRELSIAFGLEDRIDVLAADYAKSPSGALTTTWTVLHAGVRGRIQPLGMKIEDRNASLQSVRRFRIILEDPIDFDENFRLRGPDGSIYYLHSAAGFPKLGEFQTVEVEKLM